MAPKGCQKFFDVSVEIIRYALSAKYRHSSKEVVVTGRSRSPGNNPSEPQGHRELAQLPGTGLTRRNGRPP